MQIPNFSGEVIVPEYANYEEASKTFSHKGAPKIVLRPRSAQDVSVAVMYATENSLVLSVRGGGHGGGGFGTNDGGLVIDLSLINKIEVTDKEKHLVKIGGGATWIQVATFLQEDNLAISSGDTKSVGVGGLTLGGGIGWMVRKCGLALDNLVSAEIVIADGSILHLSESENPDLFWAIRGGNGNFGVVTEFEFKAHPIKKVFMGTFSYASENAEEVLKGWRNYMRKSSEDLNSTIMIMPAFAGNPPGITLLNCYVGEHESEAKQAFAPLLELGKIVNQTVVEKKYADVLEEAHYPEGMKIISNNGFVNDFSDELIKLLASTHGAETGPIAMIRYVKGALNKVKKDATAFAHRDAEVMLMSVGFFPVTAPAEAETPILEAWTTIAPYTSGTYVNFLAEPDEEKIRLAYPGETYNRLAKIKAQYDPQNLFSRNYNIKPA